MIVQYQVYAVLCLTKECEQHLRMILTQKCGVRKASVQRNMHLTIYHGRRPLPGLVIGSQTISISADLAETRFMILAPGGENPRPELEPRCRSVGIRLTRRNIGIPQILDLRRAIYALETEDVVRGRRRTSDWTNAFGARHFQPHLKLLRPGSGIDRDLAIIGKLFRAEIDPLEFDMLEIKAGSKERIRPQLPLVLDAYP
jgi:hypothetical protein